MKNPHQILEAVGKRVAATWHLDIAGESGTWPRRFALGALSKPELEAGFASILPRALEWRDWTDKHGLTLTMSPRRVHGTLQSIPTHVYVPDLDTAVELLGAEWKERIQRGRRRLAILQSAFPNTAETLKVVRAVDSYSDVDFDLLCKAASWFTSNRASGLTPRQVPIEGLHAKWLNTHQSLVQALAGLESLELLSVHPQRIHFTYLDLDHLASGKRRHDSATVGDAMTPAYLPDIVLISENKDTALHFPALRKSISVEGAGFAGARAIPSFDWLTKAKHIVYWGDMDADGFEIVNQYRQQGLPIVSILMDLTAFQTYERFGTTLDAQGSALRLTRHKDLIHLTDHERELYELLTDPEWTKVRRIEQERIPLIIAWKAVQKIANDASRRAGSHNLPSMPSSWSRS